MHRTWRAAVGRTHANDPACTCLTVALFPITLPRRFSARSSPKSFSPARMSRAPRSSSS